MTGWDLGKKHDDKRNRPIKKHTESAGILHSDEIGFFRCSPRSLVKAIPLKRQDRSAALQRPRLRTRTRGAFTAYGRDHSCKTSRKARTFILEKNSECPSARRTWEGVHRVLAKVR